MKTAPLGLFALVIFLVACSAPVLPPTLAVSAGALSAAPSAAAPAAPPTGTPVRSAAAPAPASFDIGVAPGNAYYPFSIAVDPKANVAYVYHGSSDKNRPVISVVDLTAGKVARVIALPGATPGASGQLLLAPDGARLYLQESQNYALLAIDTKTGAARKLLDGAHDVAMTEDGRLLFVAGQSALAAYAAADLLAGKAKPLWQSIDSYAHLAINGDRLLAGKWAREGALTAFDARTGTQVARVDLPESADVLSAGPDSGWAITVGGEKPRLIRYDAGLKALGETAIPYVSELSYDAANNRFLIGGWRYAEDEPRGHRSVISVNAADGQIESEVRWPGTDVPTVFSAGESRGLLGFASGGPAALYVLDPQTLTAKSAVAMGARVEDAVVDGDKTLYVADDLGRIHALALPQGKEIALWDGGAPLALDTANGRLYANRGERVVALDLRTGDVVVEFPQGGVPAPDPKRDVVYIADNGVTIYDRSGKRLGDLPSTFPVKGGFSPNPYAYSAQVNPVTGHVAVILHNGVPGSNGGSFLRIYEPQSDKYVTPPAPHSFVMDVLSDGKGDWYVAYSIARNQEAVQVLSPAGQELRRLDHRTGFLALDERRDNLYLFSEGRVARLAASTLTPLEALAGPQGVDGIAVAPDGSKAYLYGLAGPTLRGQTTADLAPLSLKPAAARIRPAAQPAGLAVTSRGKKRALAGAFDYELFRTADGKTWEQLLPGLELQFANVTAVDGGTIFVTGRSAYGGEGVWRSKDAGDTWEWLTSGLTDLLADGPVLARSSDEAYFINRGQGLLRWDPAARQWQLASGRVEGKDWSNVALAPEGTLFRSNSGTLERSSDKGATWTALGPTSRTGDVIGFSALYTVTKTIFSALRTDYRISAVQRSNDGGVTWQPSLSSLQVGLDGPLDMATGFGRAYLLARPYNGKPALLRTTDNGESWEAAPAGTADRVENIAVDPLDGRLWLGVKGGVRSVDPSKVRWTKVPAAVPPATPTPTPAPTATAGPCATPLAGGEAEIDGRALGLGCPRGPEQTVQMARQKFQNGQMIWRGDQRWIYVLNNDGTWAGYPDGWKEGDPADDPALVAPQGLQQPARGFGKVWRENLGGPNAALGWALEKEQGVEARAQDWDYGIVLRFGGETVVLQSIGTWR